MKLYFAETEKGRAIDFLNKFELQIIAVCLDRKPNNLKNRKQRVCRFCGLMEPDTSFKKVARVIPKLLGNKSLPPGSIVSHLYLL